MSSFAAEVVDADFETRGKSASYRPPGGGDLLPCLIIRDVRDGSARPDDGSPPAGQSTIRVRASEVAAPAFDGTFTMTVGGNVYAITSRPIPKDPEGMVWTMWAK